MKKSTAKRLGLYLSVSLVLGTALPVVDNVVAEAATEQGKKQKEHKYETQNNLNKKASMSIENRAQWAKFLEDFSVTDTSELSKKNLAMEVIEGTGHHNPILKALFNDQVQPNTVVAQNVGLSFTSEASIDQEITERFGNREGYVEIVKTTQHSSEALEAIIEEIEAMLKDDETVKYLSEQEVEALNTLIGQANEAIKDNNIQLQLELQETLATLLADDQALIAARKEASARLQDTIDEVASFIENLPQDMKEVKDKVNTEIEEANNVLKDLTQNPTDFDQAAEDLHQSVINAVKENVEDLIQEIETWSEENEDPDSEAYQNLQYDLGIAQDELDRKDITVIELLEIKGDLIQAWDQAKNDEALKEITEAREQLQKTIEDVHQVLDTASDDERIILEAGLKAALLTYANTEATVEELDNANQNLKDLLKNSNLDIQKLMLEKNIEQADQVLKEVTLIKAQDTNAKIDDTNLHKLLKKAKDLQKRKDPSLADLKQYNKALQKETDTVQQATQQYYKNQLSDLIKQVEGEFPELTALEKESNEAGTITFEVYHSWVLQLNEWINEQASGETSQKAVPEPIDKEALSEYLEIIDDLPEEQLTQIEDAYPQVASVLQNSRKVLNNPYATSLAVDIATEEISELVGLLTHKTAEKTWQAWNDEQSEGTIVLTLNWEGLDTDQYYIQVKGHEEKYTSEHSQIILSNSDEASIVLELYNQDGQYQKALNMTDQQDGVINWNDPAKEHIVVTSDVDNTEELNVGDHIELTFWHVTQDQVKEMQHIELDVQETEDMKKAMYQFDVQDVQFQVDQLYSVFAGVQVFNEIKQMPVVNPVVIREAKVDGKAQVQMKKKNGAFTLLYQGSMKDFNRMLVKEDKGKKVKTFWNRSADDLKTVMERFREEYTYDIGSFYWIYDASQFEDDGRVRVDIEKTEDGNIKEIIYQLAKPVENFKQELQIWVPYTDEEVDEVTDITNFSVYSSTKDRMVTVIEGEEPGDGEKPEQPALEVFPVYRAYNPEDGDHLFTLVKTEYYTAVEAGWMPEGVAWNAIESGIPIYRLYNPNTGEHFYTENLEEYEEVHLAGWKQEGIAFFAVSEEEGKPVYRSFNPNATGPGSHMYTKVKKEYYELTNYGWMPEGDAFYSVKALK